MKMLQFTFRMLKRNPLLTFVNLPGLAIGLSAILLLLVYLNFELSFDKHFPTKDRVLRLNCKVTENTKTSTYGICLRDAYTVIPSKVPEIEATTQIYRGWNVTVKSETQYFEKLDLLYADIGFFDVFGLDLLYGDKKSALEGPGKVVITSSSAKKIFNRLDCIGQVISVSDKPLIVSGVIGDLPKNTHFNFNLLVSMQTVNPEQFGGLELFTYYLIDKNADIEQTGKKIAAENDELMKPFASNFNLRAQSGTEILSKLHVHSTVDFDLSDKADFNSILIISGIALFILLIALVNFINLYVLHGEKRIAEIAARKSLGANQKNLARLFYTETGVIGLMAFVLAIFITILAQPYFAGLMRRPVEISDLLSPSGLLLVLGLLSLLILISGAYPSFYLSRINLVNALKGKSDQVKRKRKFSASTVILQITITVFLISSMIIVYSQINYLKNIPLGFSPQNVVGISGFNSEVKKKFRTIQDEISRLPFVESAGSSFHYMGGGTSGQGIKVYGDPGNYLSINEYRVHPGFCNTMQLELQGGRFFNPDENDKKSVILNEAAVKMMGLDNPLGTMVDMHGEPMKIIGVVKDFYYLNNSGGSIAPLVINDYSDEMSVFYLRVAGDFTPERQKQVASVLKQYDPDFTFGYFLLTNTFSSKFDNEERVMKMVSTGTILAILISFIGLMALSFMNVTRRTKEIGIRKVMGSTETKVMASLLLETFVLVLVAMLIAFVADYFVMHQWLSNFVNKIHLHVGYFLLSGFFALLIALLAVGWQSWKAATRNPVEALRYE
jgi:putative ABC transport system permease protein